MKTKNFKKPIALFLAVMLCASLLFSLGTTAFAAEETANVCLIAFPRDGDANYNGEWGHGNLNFMNGWSTKASAFTLIRAMGQYSGNICYCIEPGVSQQPGDSLTKKGEDFWDNYPAAYNKTISPEDIKLLIGRIFQYGYTGPISVSWRSQNDGGDKLAHAVATQLLIWETVVGERDADFNKIGTNGKDAIVDQISTNHPLYGQIMGYYSSIAASVQYHSSIPSFLAKTAAEAQSASLEWDGEAYAVTLTDKNGVLSDYSFSSSNPDIKFSVKGNELTISMGTTLNEPVTITAEKNNSRRSGVITWTDGVYGPNGKLQDTVTYAQAVADPIKGYLNLKTAYGEIHGLKKNEDGSGLAGALIGLFRADCTEFTTENAILTATSAEDGSFSFARVPFGNWIVREIEAPTSFVLSEKTYPVTVDADGAVIEVEIENTRIRGTVQLTKTDRDYPDNKLTGAEFTVYRDSNSNKELDADDELVGTLTETGIGVYEMADLLYGGYFVKEIKAPEGFYDKVGIMLLPGNGMEMVPTPGDMVGATDPEKIEAAVAFLKFETTPENQIKALEMTGLQPVSDNLEIPETLSESDPLMAQALEIQGKAGVTYGQNQAYWYQNTIDTFSTELPELAYGNITAEEFCTKLSEAAAKNLE